MSTSANDERAVESQPAGAGESSIWTGSPKMPLRTAWARLVKELIWKLAAFKPTRQPIALYASRRSGSSLLMEVIAVNAGVLFSDQPFSLFTASSSQINRLPIFPYGQLACPDASESQWIERYLQDLLAGKIRVHAPWKVWSREYHFRNNRLCLKITDAKALVEWIDRRFDVATLISTRHPVAQALSVARLGWMTTGKGFLRNPGYVERWLDTKLEALCWDIYAKGSDLQQRVVDWALENLPLLEFLRSHPDSHYLSYEELIAHPAESVSYLADRLGLSDRRAMERRVLRPSRSTRRESSAERQAMIRRGDRRGLLESWRSHVDASDIADCFRILDAFGLDLYRLDSPFPDRRRLGRPPLVEGELSGGSGDGEEPPG